MGLFDKTWGVVLILTKQLPFYFTNCLNMVDIHRFVAFSHFIMTAILQHQIVLPLQHSNQSCSIILDDNKDLNKYSN